MGNIITLFDDNTFLFDNTELDIIVEHQHNTFSNINKSINILTSKCDKLLLKILELDNKLYNLLTECEIKKIITKYNKNQYTNDQLNKYTNIENEYYWDSYEIPSYKIYTK